MNTAATAATKSIYNTQNPLVTGSLELWVHKAMSQNIDMTGEVLFQKYSTFKELAGTKPEDQLTLSQDWLHCLKKQLRLKEFKQHGRAASANP